MTMLLIVLLVVLLVGGGWGYGRVGPGAFGPLGAVLVIFLILYLMGYFH